MKNKKNFLLTGALFLLFSIFTVIGTTVDVKPIGPEQSYVGLASLNQFVFELFGVNLLWYTITDWLGVVAILFAFGFAALGLIQLVKRKSLLKVDFSILILGVFYVLVIAFYLLFENVIINYRPIILHTSLEASYPSSHTMIVICIMATAMLQFHRLLAKHRTWLVVLDCISVLLIVVTIGGRLISGVHWFTDIVAGIILSSALVMLYYSVITHTEQRNR
ncbi:MAG: phosphatase PAP2 family protein [Enterocloster citroniae]|nr:phosphatase PAP2 family protein [Enterocloster citroniae]